MSDEPRYQAILQEAWAQSNDPVHDLSHVRRVVMQAKAIALAEGGDMDVILPAAWLHDIVNVPKNSPDRKRASVLSADEAVRQLAWMDAERLARIHHAIAAHSFSAQIIPETLEAKIVQDADRLDALGAIGIARCFATGGQMGTRMFHADDPLARHRARDDLAYSLDHYEVKLYRVADTLNTATAREIAGRRVALMREFEAQMAADSGAVI